MTERDQLPKLNQLPLNLHSALLLRKTSQSPEPDSLHALQLMQWGADQGRVKLVDKYRPALEAMLDRLLHQTSPQQALRFLVESQDPQNPEELVFNLDEFLQINDPLEAAEYLWSQLHDQMGTWAGNDYHLQPQLP